MRGPTAALAAMVAVLSLAACGSSGSGDSPASTAAGTTATATARATTPAPTHRRPRRRATRPKHPAPAPTARRPSHAAFIRRADRVCRASHRRVAELSAQLAALLTGARSGRVKPGDYYRRSAAVTDAMGRAGQSAVAELRALPHRAGDRRLQTFLIVAGEESALVRRQAQALRRRDAPALRALVARTLRLGRRSHRLARTYGFRACGGASAKTLR